MWSWSDSPLVRHCGLLQPPRAPHAPLGAGERPTGTRCTGLGLLQALTEANVANIEILNRACLRWSSTTWSTNLSAISEGFPRQKAARHAAATTAGCNGIMTRTQTEATRTHSLMSPMLVTSDETGLESVGGEIVSGRADGSKGVRGGDALKMIASPTVTGCQASSIATSSTRTQAVSSVCSLTASTLATLGFLLPAASHAGSRS